MQRNPSAGGASSYLPMIFILFLTWVAGASSAFISDIALDSRIPGPARGRTLLQAKKSCPVSFEQKNYTIITSQCKGPQYPPKLCCAAFLEFSCPYADQINDPTNDCATTMFSYINLYGSYPPGLFASECKDSKRGLECAGVPASDADQESSSLSSPTTTAASSHVVAVFFFLMYMIFY